MKDFLLRWKVLFLAVLSQRLSQTGTVHDGWEVQDFHPWSCGISVIMKEDQCEEITPDSWFAELLSLMWQFLQGILELLQLAWLAVVGSSGVGGMEAKKNDDLGQQRHRKPPKRRGAPHIPVMVLPAAKTLPSLSRQHPPSQHGKRADQLHAGKLPWQQQQQPQQQQPHRHQQQALVAAAPRGQLLSSAPCSPRSSGLLPPCSLPTPDHQEWSIPPSALPPHADHPSQQQPVQPSGLSPRHSFHIAPHPHFAAAADPRPFGRPGTAIPKRHLAPGGLPRYQSLPEGSIYYLQKQPLSPRGPLPVAPGDAAMASPRQPAAAAAGAAAAARAAVEAAGLSCEVIAYGELEIEELVGEGGFAKVFRAHWRGQEVAVKLLNPESSSQMSVLEEFRREVSVLGSLGPHPNIVRLVGACTQPPNLAVITQYCSGGSLYALLHSPHATLSWGRLVDICLGVARGVHFLHVHGVLHRDLKSGNLLLDGEGGVKLADFGLSRMVQHAGPMTGGLGTYQWMAPEVLGHQRYSQKADTYSFAMIMWECAARQIPYTGMDGVQAALAVMNRGLRPEIPPHTPAPFARLMQLCWAPTPDQRPDFGSVVEELERMGQEVRHQQQQQQQQQRGQQGENQPKEGLKGAAVMALCDAV